MKYLILFLFSLTCLALKSQTITAESFVELPNSNEAAEAPVYDFNNDKCALVNVTVDASEMEFGGNVVKTINMPTGYKVYYTDGTNTLILKHPNLRIYRLKTSKFGIDKLIGGHTYSLKLEIPDYLRARVGEILENYVATGIKNHYVQIEKDNLISRQSRYYVTIFNGAPQEDKKYSRTGSLMRGVGDDETVKVVNVSDGEGANIDTLTFRQIFKERQSFEKIFPLFKSRDLEIIESGLSKLKGQVYIIGFKIIDKLKKFAADNVINTWQVKADPRENKAGKDMIVDIVLFDWDSFINTYAQSSDKKVVEGALVAYYFYYLCCAETGGLASDKQIEDFVDRGFYEIMNKDGDNMYQHFKNRMTDGLQNAYDKYYLKSDISGRTDFNGDVMLEDGDGHGFTLTINSVDIDRANPNKATINAEIDNKTRRIPKVYYMANDNGRWKVDDVSVTTSPLKFFRETVESMDLQPIKNNPPKPVREDAIYDISTIEKRPTFLGGGDLELYRYISRSLIYPKEALDQKIKGRVVVEFVVEKDGSVSNIRVLRSLSPDTDNEAVRIFRNMPKWEPGETNGRKVRTKVSYPVTFKLPQE